MQCKWIALKLILKLPQMCRTQSVFSMGPSLHPASSLSSQLQKGLIKGMLAWQLYIFPQCPVREIDKVFFLAMDHAHESTRVLWCILSFQSVWYWMSINFCCDNLGIWSFLINLRATTSVAVPCLLNCLWKIDYLPSLVLILSNHTDILRDHLSLTRSFSSSNSIPIDFAWKIRKNTVAKKQILNMFRFLKKVDKRSQFYKDKM